VWRRCAGSSWQRPLLQYCLGYVDGLLCCRICPDVDSRPFTCRKLGRQFPAFVLTIVGGPVTERFTDVAGDNVVLSDFVEDMNEQFRQKDLNIGAGRVVIEAMAFGLPVISVGEAC